MNLRIPQYAFSLPFFMFDIYNYQLITTYTIPGDIKDDKDILLTEIPIPGLNYQPIQYSGGGNRKISFTLPLIKRNNTIGNSVLLKQFDVLRNQATGVFDIYAKQFQPNPKVLFYWGTGSVPLIYYVKKVNFSNKQGWINQMGQPQYSEVEIELWLDENDNWLYKAEEMYRKVSSIAGEVITAVDAIPMKGRRF